MLLYKSNQTSLPKGKEVVNLGYVSFINENDDYKFFNKFKELNKQIKILQ